MTQGALATLHAENRPHETLKPFAARPAGDVLRVLTLEGSVASRDHAGGTAPRRVREAIAAARASLAHDA